MAKIRKTIRAGSLVKIIEYPKQNPRDGNHVRAAKRNASSAAQKAANIKSSRGLCEMLLAENFTLDAHFVTVTYDDAHLPKTANAAKVQLRKFVRRLRDARKLRGEMLTYIYVTEGKHGEKRFHHHLVINATQDREKDREEIESLWDGGEVVHIQPLAKVSELEEVQEIGDNPYSRAAYYMTKEPAADYVGAQMWTASKGLSRPDVQTEIVNDCDTVDAPPRAVVLEREERQSEYGAYKYVKYALPVTVSQGKRPRRKAPPLRGGTAREGRLI